MYDLYVPLTENFDMEIPYEKAQEIILEALKPLGEEYLENVKKAFSEGWIDVYFGLKGDGAPQLKRYLSEVQQGVVPTSYWSYDECGHNDEARKELKDIFGQPPFTSPKPTRLLFLRKKLKEMKVETK